LVCYLVYLLDLGYAALRDKLASKFKETDQ